MFRQTGPIRINDDGIALSGTICRILVLPGHAKEAVDNLKWISENVGNEVGVSVMAQYVPAYRATEIQPWNRRIFISEYDMVKETMEVLNFEICWIQDIEGRTEENLIGYKMPPGSTTG